MSLLFPLGLLALAAWLVPLLVHLARRQQHAPLEFAALRWLRTAVKPRRQVRLDEWPLLLVRLLLLALLALLLARPMLDAPAADRRGWHVVAPGLDIAALRAQQPDSHWHWLAPGFPSVDAPMPAPQQPLASLLRELDQQLPAGTPLSVHVPDPLPGLDGQRLQLSRAVDWHPIAVSPAPAAATLPPPRLQPAGTASETGAAWLPLLAALQRAWNNSALLPVQPDAPLPADGAIGVWLADGQPPAAWQQWVRDGGRVLMAGATREGSEAWQNLLEDAHAQPLLQSRAQGRGQWLRFAGHSTPGQQSAWHEADVPLKVLQALQPAVPASVASALDQRPGVGAPAPRPAPRDPTPWLVLAIVLVFALERLLASRPRPRPPS